MPNQITQNLRKKNRNNSDQIVTAATEPLACQRRKRTLAGTGNEMVSLSELNLGCGQQFQYLLIANGESQLAERSALDPIGRSPLFPL